MAEKRPALGRGLSALIPETPPSRAFVHEIDIDRLAPNRMQPRTGVDAANLDVLAQSIRTHGVIQPLVVRQEGGGYEIVAGERRWRAAQRAGLLRVPVVVRDVADSELLPLALIENLQRENLDPIEEARAFQCLIEDYRFTQEDLAAEVGKDRSSIANALRLLRLPDDIKADLAAGLLSVGQARALLGLSDEVAQRRAAREIVRRGLSVREVEALVKHLAGGEPAARSAPREPDVHIRAAEERLRFALGTRVRVVSKGKGGRIEIDFTSADELQRLFEQLTER